MEKIEKSGPRMTSEIWFWSSVKVLI
jgi:hypothetical protein